MDVSNNNNRNQKEEGPSIEDELIAILKNKSLNFEARSTGWQYLLGLSMTDDGLDLIINSEKYLPFILSCVTQECKTGPEEELTKFAFKAVLNISSDEQGRCAILRRRKDICNYLLNAIAGKGSKFVEYKCCVLSNMSANSEFLEQIIHILLSSRGLYESLIEVYCSADVNLKSQYDFLTLVFANMSRVSAGRRLFLLDSVFMNNIVKFTQPSEPESRRLGAALILRNCCMETEYHEKLLNDLDIHSALLLPLMVPQQYEEGGEMGQLPPDLQQRCLDEVKEREKSVSVRRVLVEALTVLCYSENSWRFLKSNGTYYVVRDLHTWETDPVCKETIEQLVAYFLVTEYSKPDTVIEEDNEFIHQLEADITKNLPDFVMQS